MQGPTSKRSPQPLEIEMEVTSTPSPEALVTMEKQLSLGTLASVAHRTRRQGDTQKKKGQRWSRV